MTWENYIPDKVKQLYEVYDFKHAAAILSKEFPDEFSEICATLLTFRFSSNDIIEAGGNESKIPKIFSDLLRPLGWVEHNLEAELNVFEVRGKNFKELKSSISHGSLKVDYLKGRVALSVERLANAN